MRSLLSAASRTGDPVAGFSRVGLASALRRAQAAHLRALLQQPRRPLSEEDALNLRDHATYLDLLADEVGPDEAGDAHFVAGTIFEWLARIGPTRELTADAHSLTDGPVGDLIRASLAYSSGDHEASSSLAAQRALEQFEDRADDHPITHAAGLVILTFLARRFGDVLERHVEYGDTVRELRANGFASGVDWAAQALVSRIAEACSLTSAGMLAGSDPLLALGLSTVDRVVAASVGVARPSLVALAGRTSQAIAGISSRSTQSVLRGAGVSPDRARWFGTRVPELWSSQQRAIDEGLLRANRSFVLSLPTGSGKTFLTQIAILSTLDREPGTWVAYLAPTRALVREVHRELGSALRIHGIRVQKVMAGAEAAVFSEEDELPVLTAARACAVLTPERLDLYLRASPEIADRLRLVIVDEAHTLADGARGARLEALITQILVKWPHIRFHLLSAFLPNTTELTEWLGDDAGSFRSAVRPTRQVKGICMRYQDRELESEVAWRVGNRLARGDEAPPGRTVVKRFIERHAYKVGAILASEPDDVRGQQAIALADLAEGVNETEARVRGRRIASRTVLTDIAGQVAASLAAHPGMVLVFLPQTSWTRAVTRAVADGLPVIERLTPFANAIQTSLGPEHPLVYAIRRGVAYHNSRLPDEVLRVVEAAARAGLLEVLCATSGLQAGVNLPASVVLVVGDPNPANQPSPSVRDFANMAGRSGRPGHDTEGTTLFLPPSIVYRNRPLDQTTRDYLFSGDADLGMESALGDELERLARDPEIVALSDMSEQMQQILLGLWAVEIRERAEVKEFLERTIAARELAGQLDDRLSTALESASRLEGDRFIRFARTALPYDACRDLAEVLPSLRVRAADDGWGESAVRQAGDVASALMRVPYFATRISRLLGPGTDEEAMSGIAARWVEGASYPALAEQMTATLAGRFDAARATTLLGTLSSLLGWGSGALLGIASIGDERIQANRMLPYFLRYGVETEVAAYLRLLGVSDRAGARAVAMEFPADREVTLTSVQQWTYSAAARQTLASHYGIDEVSMLATEADLGIEAPPIVGTALRVVLRQALPPWVQPGRFARAVEIAGDWSLVDTTTGQVAPVTQLTSPGLLAPSEELPDGLETFTFPMRT